MRSCASKAGITPARFGAFGLRRLAVASALQTSGPPISTYNGQADLLIAVVNGGNGHCVNNVELIALLFDAEGRPVPWIVNTSMPSPGRHPPHRPAILLDVNKDGRAEIVTTQCGPWDADSLDYQVTGVYEAHDTRWVPMRDTPLKPYVQAAHAAHRATPYPPGYIHWLPVEPKNWVDQMRLVDGPSESPSREGWPGVVIDGPKGRGIYTDETEDVLSRVLDAGYRFKIFGENSRPSWFWVYLH